LGLVTGKKKEEMASPSPLLYDTYYHIFGRGTNRENIFVEERNCEYFLQLYAKHIEPVAETFAYCLLRNHFHLLVRIKSEQETLKVFQTDKRTCLQSHPARQSSSLGEKPFRSNYPSKKFSDFFNAYAKAINKAYGRTGSLFQHPFGRVAVTSDRQFWNVIAYIHQNPQKHKFVDDFREWKYSSYVVILSEKPTRLQRDVVLDWFGGPKQYLDLHAEWVTETQSKWFAEEDSD
jgi:REP element-mobilizing transposase RayT